MSEGTVLMREQELTAAAWLLMDSEGCAGSWFLLSALENPPNFILLSFPHLWKEK